MNDLDLLSQRLARSKFRSSFKLKRKELSYFKEKGISQILEHAFDFIEKRLAPALSKNDGKQTPYGKHPVFVAQHATGTCCRGCLEKWHKIPKRRELDEDEKKYIVSVIERWLLNQTRLDLLFIYAIIFSLSTS